MPPFCVRLPVVEVADPRFLPLCVSRSLRLMHWAREYILSMSPENGMDPRVSPPPPKPHQVLSAAWEYTIGEKVSRP